MLLHLSGCLMRYSTKSWAHVPAGILSRWEESTLKDLGSGQLEAHRWYAELKPEGGLGGGRSCAVGSFFSFTFILWNYVLSTKLGKEVNSNKRGLECTCFPCQVLEKRYSLHWASGNRALAGDVISRSTVSVCFTSIICEGSTDLNLLWFLPWDTFSLVWCPVQALQGFKVCLKKRKNGICKRHASLWHVSVTPLAVMPLLYCHSCLRKFGSDVFINLTDKMKFLSLCWQRWQLIDG